MGTKEKLTDRVRTPGGILKRRRKPKSRRTVNLCSECGAVLHGTNIKKKLPKTQKRPTRTHASTLCTNCLKDKIKEGVRK